ncbi:MAG: glycosyltransferase family 39 protein [Anaerolineae bacterium]|nr:glycosyltransferase family 39 protein [Anaerolineae bacterium]
MLSAVWMVLVLAAAYPLTDGLLRRSPHPVDPWLRLALVPGLSLGVLTLLMFWLGLPQIPFTFLNITIPYGIVMGVGGWFWWRAPKTRAIASELDDRTRQSTFARPSLAQLILWLIPLLIVAAVLFNAIYWPFYLEDAVGIYADRADFMYRSGGLVPLRDYPYYGYYQTYPMLIPMSYTYAYFASGWHNEYLAKALSAVLSLSCLPAVMSLGSAIGGRRLGWLALLLLAITPAFGRWASSGYVDLPMACFYILAALFCWRLWQRSNPTDAILLGLSIGFAAWTKNAALPGIGLIGLWLFYAVLMKHVGWRDGLLALIACLLVAAPWYIRNWIEVQMLVPNTVWVDQAQRTLANLVPFLTRLDNFALTGIVITLGLFLEAVDFLRGGWREGRSAVLLILTVPYLVVWWAFVSYDPRFLLLFLPILIVLGAKQTLRIADSLPPRIHQKIRPLALAGIVVLALYVAWISVAYKDEILRDPLMSDAAKRAIVLPQLPDQSNQR